MKFNFKIKNTYLIFLILILFTSCDPGIINKYIVENKTDSEINIESILIAGRRKTSEKDSIKLVTIESQSEDLITLYGEIGTAHDKGINFLEGIDTVIIKRIDKTLKKNIFERKNWNFKIIKSGLLSMDEVEYKLILTEKDFE